jgi:hypothetical protein
MEPSRVCRPVVADHITLTKKSDPDLPSSEILDLVPHSSEMPDLPLHQM